MSFKTLTLVSLFVILMSMAWGAPADTEVDTTDIAANDEVLSVDRSGYGGGYYDDGYYDDGYGYGHGKHYKKKRHGYGYGYGYGHGSGHGRHGRGRGKGHRKGRYNY